MQAMFIDVDGTLSSPCYKVNGKFQIGMSDVQWADYCSKHGEDTYEWCRPVMQVKEYAMKAKEKGTKLYVLTTSGTKIETAAKRRFLDRYYGTDYCCAKQVYEKDCFVGFVVFDEFL
jgi:phosphoglycolate phosphatase-like HAD superfamily hydrolase